MCIQHYAAQTQTAALTQKYDEVVKARGDRQLVEEHLHFLVLRVS